MEFMIGAGFGFFLGVVAMVILFRWELNSGDTSLDEPWKKETAR